MLATMTERTGSITVNDLLKAITPETFQELGLKDLNFSLGFEIASKIPLGNRLTMLNREDLRKLGQLTGLHDADEIVFDTAEEEAGLGFPYPYASRITPGDTWFSYLKQFNGHLKVHTVNIEPETKNDDWQLLIVEGVTDVFARKYVEGEGQEETVKEFDILFGWVSRQELAELEDHCKKAWALDAKIYEGVSF